MSRFKMLFTFLCFEIVLSAPAAGLGFWLLGWEGAVAGAVLVLLASGLIALFVEQGVSSNYPVQLIAFPGLEKSFEKVMTEIGGAWPRVRVYSDPVPNALIFRSIGATGTILLSQGALAILDEEELQFLLRLSVLKARERGILYRSFFALLAIWILKLAPQAWLNLLFKSQIEPKTKPRHLSPVSAALFLMVYFVGKIFLRLSQAPARALPAESFDQVEREAARHSALHKISQSLTYSRAVGSPAALALFLFDPWSSQMLVRLN